MLEIYGCLCDRMSNLAHNDGEFPHECDTSWRDDPRVHLLRDPLFQPENYNSPVNALYKSEVLSFSISFCVSA